MIQDIVWYLFRYQNDWLTLEDKKDKTYYVALLHSKALSCEFNNNQPFFVDNIFSQRTAWIRTAFSRFWKIEMFISTVELHNVKVHRDWRQGYKIGVMESIAL